MIHKAIKVKILDGTKLEMTFQNGEVKEYDVANLFDKYPKMRQLQERSLFTQGKLLGSSGVYWNDELDLDADTIYEDGIKIREEDLPIEILLGDQIRSLRKGKKISQQVMAKKTGIDQSDISKIERGVANPSISTLKRIANALDSELQITIK